MDILEIKKNIIGMIDRDKFYYLNEQKRICEQKKDWATYYKINKLMAEINPNWTIPCRGWSF